MENSSIVMCHNITVLLRLRLKTLNFFYSCTVIYYYYTDFSSLIEYSKKNSTYKIVQ